MKVLTCVALTCTLHACYSFSLTSNSMPHLRHRVAAAREGVVGQRWRENVEKVSGLDRTTSSSTDLKMKGNSMETLPLFDGHKALSHERDACGVGFIANPESGPYGNNRVLKQGEKRNLTEQNKKIALAQSCSAPPWTVPLPALLAARPPSLPRLSKCSRANERAFQRVAASSQV